MMLAHNNYPFFHGHQHQHQHQHQHHQLQPHQLQQQLQHSQQQYNNQQQFQDQQGHFNASDPTAFSTTLDNIPAAAAAFAATQRYQHRRPATSSSQGVNPMSSNSWMLHGQQTPRQSQQFGHQRDSSLSSVGSNPPASPYNANTANPHIAVTDAVADGLHDLAGGENHYTFGMTKPVAVPDSFYSGTIGHFDSSHGGAGTNGHHVMGDMATADGLPALTGAQQQRQGGLVPASDMQASGLLSRSRPVSVASSIGGDSPATPPIHDHEDDHRRPKNAYANGAHTPKLDRTMTDVYGDELYSPNFTITSASPPPQTHMVMSPPSDLFTQRVQAANSQHFLATQSPVSNDSGAQSPFRHGSPYASAINDFPKVGTNRVRLESAQQLRERRKAEEDAKQLQRQMARHAQQGQQQQQTQQQQNTPTTISPKDAVLEFNETDADSNFPLFPPQDTSTYGLGPNTASADMSRATSQQSASSFQPLATTPVQSGFNFSMPSNIQIPQQYPFIPRQPRQQQQSQQQQQRQQQLASSASTFSRMSSAEASNTDGSSSSSGGPVQRPDRTAADGGTYTCTYHGCTLRFDTPALLQKHKREGHRQASTLNHLRSPAIMGQAANSVPSSQAGPHRCDRINPSTGKPCNTVFSRPYDLTRHEDTIHNAKKQKVRCDLCSEEKLFSRADALTRHYRVCHPDVDVPGKHNRRRGV